LNFYDTKVDLEPLTDKDRADLDYVTTHADMIGHSFVESGDRVALLQGELARSRKDWRTLGLVAKIETPRAVSNLPEIIVQAAGNQPIALMIARGDLAVASSAVLPRGAVMVLRRRVPLLPRRPGHVPCAPAAKEWDGRSSRLSTSILAFRAAVFNHCFGAPHLVGNLLGAFVTLPS
jgi:hypothetical protein